jgi:hypothetical protein
MGRLTKSFRATALLTLVTQFIAIAPASAVEAELAGKCRQLMVKAYPHQAPGTKKGIATAQRKYFQDCIKNNGIMPKIDNLNLPPAPPDSR